MKLQGKSGVAEKNRRKYFAQSIYCNESIMNIENYGKALNDNFKGWLIHHRLETHNSDGEKRLVALEAEELMALDMYYNRPASELIFLTEKEHGLIHNNRKHFSLSDEAKHKISNSKLGEKNPAKREEVRAKISATTKISCKDLHKECREAYKKSGRKDWNTFQKDFYGNNRI